jgi:hypothetical protein
VFVKTKNNLSKLVKPWEIIETEIEIDKPRKNLGKEQKTRKNL